MARPVEICTVGLRIFVPEQVRGEDRREPRLQQSWQIVDGGETRYEWRDVPLVKEETDTGDQSGT